MRGITHRTTGWLGITFVVLLFLNAGMVSLPPSSWSEQAVAEFYAANRSIILIAQVIGLIAAPVFVAFALGLQKNMSAGGGIAGTGAVGLAGILVALVSVGTAVPVIALSLNAGEIPFW
jgi:succinate dehydrogenase/fumarate reductase cytochrome b subunit